MLATKEANLKTILVDIIEDTFLEETTCEIDRDGNNLFITGCNPFLDSLCDCHVEIVVLNCEYSNLSASEDAKYFLEELERDAENSNDIDGWFYHYLDSFREEHIEVGVRDLLEACEDKAQTLNEWARAARIAVDRFNRSLERVNRKNKNRNIDCNSNTISNLETKQLIAA